VLWIAMVPSLAAPAAAALIQVRGTPLAGGTPSGSVVVPLERASGGDTPVLTFRSERGPVRLLVDTGASNHLVTPALAARLGLPSTPVPPEAFGLAGAGSECGDLRPRRASLPPLEVVSDEGGLRISGAEALLLPVPGLPDGVDGVLGAPLLRRLPLWIDPRRQRLALGTAALTATRSRPAEERQPPARIQLRWQKGVPVSRVIGPGGGVEALLDTGAEGLFVTPALAGRLSPLGPAQALRITGFCGLQKASRLPMRGIGWPGEPLEPLETVITENPVFAELGVEVILGQELLRKRGQLWRLDQSPPMLTLW
jgi:predicted aspartyl protease